MIRTRSISVESATVRLYALKQAHRHHTLSTESRSVYRAIDGTRETIHTSKCRRPSKSKHPNGHNQAIDYDQKLFSTMTILGGLPPSVPTATTMGGFGRADSIYQMDPAWSKAAADSRRRDRQEWTLTRTSLGGSGIAWDVPCSGNMDMASKCYHVGQAFLKSVGIS